MGYVDRLFCRLAGLRLEELTHKLLSMAVSLFQLGVGKEGAVLHKGVICAGSVVLEVNEKRLVVVNVEKKAVLNVSGIEHKQVLDLNDDGERWEGDVLNNQPCGWGVLYDSEGEKKYETKSGPRLSADDVMRRTKLHEYQNSYAKTMKSFGLQRGIVGSTAKHQVNSDYYRQQVIQYEEDIAKLQADVEKAQEGRNTILAWFGKGDLAKAKKELADKDGQIAELNKRIKELLAEKERLQERHKSEIEKLRNGYQAEIDAAIRRAEAAEQHSKEKDAVIDRQRKQIDQLDRKANPQRYSLSSGAELVRINVSNYRNPSLHIWTRVGEELFEDTKFQIDYDAVSYTHLRAHET